MAASRYLDLLASSLLGELYLESDFREIYLRHCREQKEQFHIAMLENVRSHPRWNEFVNLRAVGRFLDDDLANTGSPYTMIGRARLDHLRWSMEQIVRCQIPGDFIECGVWRGGAVIFMRGFLAANSIPDRNVWVADSFQGLPAPSLPEDEGLDMSAAVYPMLAVSLDTVRDNFARHHLLDRQVRFLPGWFRQTLPAAPIEQLALLRIDGDLYESTRDALANLYHRVAQGGFVIVDDYHCIPQCARAVEEFRRLHNITGPLERIDWTAVYWRKSQP